MWLPTVALAADPLPCERLEDLAFDLPPTWTARYDPEWDTWGFQAPTPDSNTMYARLGGQRLETPDAHLERLHARYDEGVLVNVDRRLDLADGWALWTSTVVPVDPTRPGKQFAVGRVLDATPVLCEADWAPSDAMRDQAIAICRSARFAKACVREAPPPPLPEIDLTGGVTDEERRIVVEAAAGFVRAIAARDAGAAAAFLPTEADCTRFPDAGKRCKAEIRAMRDEIVGVYEGVVPKGFAPGEPMVMKLAPEVFLASFGPPDQATVAMTLVRPAGLDRALVVLAKKSEE